MAALQGPRAPVAERAAGAVAEVTIAGGASFMASRWRSQAWPALASLLAGRPIPPPRPGVGPDERTEAPAAAARARLAALRSLTATAECTSSRGVLQVVAAEVADAVVEGALAADGHPPAVHAAARQTLAALAAVDVDAVWLALTSIMPQPRPAAPAPAGCRDLTEVLPRKARTQPLTAAGAARFEATLSCIADVTPEWHGRAVLATSVNNTAA